MAQYRIATAAELLGVSTNTARRWIANGRLPATTDEEGRQRVEGVDLAAIARSLAPGDPAIAPTHSDECNRATGLVTRVIKDKVMAQVDIQCGPHRFVSLMSRQSVEDLGLEVGDLATVAVDPAAVIVENPSHRE